MSSSRIPSTAILAFEHPSRATKGQDCFVDACGLDDAAVDRDIAVEHAQTTVGGIGILDRTNTAVFAVVVECVPSRALAKGNLGGNAGRASTEEFLGCRRAGWAHDVPLVESGLE